MPSQITRHLTATRGMADVNGVLQIKMRGQGCKVVCVVIHVMAVARLAGSAVAAPVMCYDAIAVTEEEQHLVVPIIGRQRPTMAEYDGLTFAPVLVEDLNAVSGFDCAHVTPSSAQNRLLSIKSARRLRALVVSSDYHGNAAKLRKAFMVDLPQLLWNWVQYRSGGDFAVIGGALGRSATTGDRFSRRELRQGSFRRSRDVLFAHT